MNNSVKEEQSSSSSEDVPFHEVYSILANYREKNGDLDIPRRGEAMKCLIPALNKIGFAQVSSHTPSAGETNKSSHQEATSVGDSVVHDKQSDSGSIEQKSAAAPIKKEAAATTTTTNVTKIKGRCDICEQKDGFRGYNLQKCSACGLAVHERCYGMALTTTKNSDFVCKACAVIGSKVEINKPSILGVSSSTKERIRVQERPTECVLCGVQDGIHAMHPLFDTHGPEGRQLLISPRGNNRKLAWVHTLCANFICTKTGGSVYGCYGNDGRYEDDSDEEYSDEENEVRFYVMATKENGKETDWSKIIADYRKSIKCQICGQRDNSGDSLRVPLQCSANDVNELVDFKRRHNDRSECFVGMHVGCARWKESPPTVFGKSCKMCYFFDGDDDGTHDEPQLACYCRAHAEDIIKNNPKYTHRRNIPERPLQTEAKKPNPPVAARKRQSTNKPEKRKIDHQTSFKRSLTNIRKGSKTVEKKRKFGASDESPPKRSRVNNEQESSTVFPVRGRSNQILSSAIPAGLKRSSIELEDDDQHKNKKFKSELDP